MVPPPPTRAHFLSVVQVDSGHQDMCVGSLGHLAMIDFARLWRRAELGPPRRLVCTLTAHSATADKTFAYDQQDVFFKRRKRETQIHDQRPLEHQQGLGDVLQCARLQHSWRFASPPGQGHPARDGEGGEVCYSFRDFTLSGRQVERGREEEMGDRSSREERDGILEMT